MSSIPNRSDTSKAVAAKPHLALLIILSALSPVALNIFLPSMPNLTENLNTSYSISQLTLTLYLLALAFSQLILGPLSDKYGRRPVLLVGIIIFAFSSLYCAFVVNIEQLIIGRIFQAIGGCAGLVITRAIVRDIYGRDKAASVLGYMTMMMAIMPLSAPIIGGYIDQFAGWRSSFYLVTFMGIAAYSFAYFKLHETNHNPIKDIDITNILSKYRMLLVEKEYLTYIIGMAFGSAVFYSFVAGAPFLATKTMGLLPSQYGFYFMMVSVGYMTGNFLSGRLAIKLGNRKMIMISNMILTIGTLILLTFSHIFSEKTGFTHPAYLFIPMSFIACSNGIAIPNAMAGALSVRPDIAGTASGLAGFSQVAFGAFATFIVGYFHNGTAMPMVVCMLISAIGAVTCFMFLKKLPEQISAE